MLYIWRIWVKYFPHLFNTFTFPQNIFRVSSCIYLNLPIQPKLPTDLSNSTVFVNSNIIFITASKSRSFLSCNSQDTLNQCFVYINMNAHLAELFQAPIWMHICILISTCRFVEYLLTLCFKVFWIFRMVFTELATIKYEACLLFHLSIIKSTCIYLLKFLGSKKCKELYMYAIR